MYYIFFLILFIAILFAIIFQVRKKKIRKKICHMSCCEKITLLNKIIAPFGYWYEPHQDIFSSRMDSWQKQYGYHRLFDKMSPFFNMVFDSKPIYFDYDDRTWLIEFWKGQYGINTGSEVGIYYTDRILKLEERESAHYTAVSEDEFMLMSTSLFHKDKFIARLEEPHWWLTTFSLGYFSYPDDLSLDITLRFPTFEMRNAFIEALYQNGYNSDTLNLWLFYTDVSFHFQESNEHFSLPIRILRRYALWKNRQFCRLYHFVTKPFSTSLDKILYLYFYLPFAFRRMLRIKRFCPKKKRRDSHGV